MKLNKISLRDQALFAKFLSLSQHELSVYAFENIYIWKGLFDIEWIVINDSLCIFFKDKIGTFLYLPPLSKDKDPMAIKEVFKILDVHNKNKDISRIENIEEKDASFYEDLGYKCEEKYYDYLCAKEELTSLKGKRFKAKRANLNYFIKHYNFQYLPFSLKYKDDCLRLFNGWMRERKSKIINSIYRGMLEDSRKTLKIALDRYSDLNFIGGIVRINNKIKAFTFGFKLNSDTFCILYEITDLSVKGLAQFIFSRFCKELRDYKYINIMDDSGLESLKKVKLSYHPIKLIPSFIVKRKDAKYFG